jgi:hypothetical protein
MSASHRPAHQSVSRLPQHAPAFSTSYADFELKIRKQLQEMFGNAGFDARRDIAGIVINRWGHAYIAPQPGFYFGSAERPAPLEVIRIRYHRIAFGHSELSGRQSWGRAAREAQRATKQILAIKPDLISKRSGLGRLVNRLNGAIDRQIELRVRLLRREPFRQCTRETGNHAVLSREFLVRLRAAIPAR